MLCFNLLGFTFSFLAISGSSQLTLEQKQTLITNTIPHINFHGAAGSKGCCFGEIYLNDHFQLYITQRSSLLALQPLQRLIFSGKNYKKI